MVFNSLWFVLFLFVVVITTNKVPNNIKYWLLLLANIFFYSTNSFLSLCLIIVVILISYYITYYVDKHKSRLSIWLSTSIMLTPLVLYKYLNFLFESFGIEKQSFFSVLPIGISFYTFQTLGYVFDVYRNRVKRERNFLKHALFASMFCYYGGPIGRSESLFSQLNDPQKFGSFNEANSIVGIRQLLLGCFLKVFVAESIALGVDPIYSNLSETPSLNILVATILFGFQLYCDFGGYSLMAQGTASCLNINVITNFKEPYCSVSISDFWRRWHISLSTWFRDYVYIPLGGSRCSKIKKYRNLMITFVLSGLWHGANWTYVIWGALNGLYLCVESFFNGSSVKKTGKEAFIGRMYTCVLIFIAWGVFRSSSITDAFFVIKSITIGIWGDLFEIIQMKKNFLDYYPLSPTLLYDYALIILGLFSVISIDIIQYRKKKLEYLLSEFTASKRLFVYISIISLLLIFGKWVSAGNFIYLAF